MKPGAGAGWAARAAEILRCSAGDLMGWRILPGEGISVIAPDGRKLFIPAAELEKGKEFPRPSSVKRPTPTLPKGREKNGPSPEDKGEKTYHSVKGRRKRAIS
jgi:hypothetical protein